MIGKTTDWEPATLSRLQKSADERIHRLIARTKKGYRLQPASEPPIAPENDQKPCACNFADCPLHALVSNITYDSTDGSSMDRTGAVAPAPEPGIPGGITRTGNAS